jgi:HD-GYP domain-containing protein (c-di-GMP phosphodiesterase class II)
VGATSIADQFVTAIQSNQEYIPVHISSLRVDSVTGFDLFLRVRPDEPVVLYAERNTPFGERSRRRLQENRVEYLYISSSQQGLYRAYLESHLPAILQDPSIETEAKSEILYASAHGLMQEIFENPELDGALGRSRDLVKNTIQFMYGQRRALRHLIQAASTDYQLYTHAVNGFVLGMGLALRAGIGTPKELAAFGTGAMLRDIGMTRVPQTIREATGKLTVSQFDMLKRHTEMGEEMVAELGETNRLTLDIVRHHHERIDGTGYPDRLEGNGLQPLLKVMTIADTFDALTTRRNHQRPMGSFEALRLMRLRMNRELDPALLDLFVRMMGNPETAKAS